MKSSSKVSDVNSTLSTKSATSMNNNDLVKKSEDEKPEEEEREQFGNTLEFFFSVLGYAVGVGNVWRFPYLAYRNGGGVFLIPYFIFMLLIGIPMVYLEFIVGQFSSMGPLTSWRMVKIARGAGISMNIANTLYVIYYNLIIAYSLYFLVMSFNTELPWQKCNPAWASSNCVDDFSDGVFKFNNCTGDDFFKCANKTSENYGRCFNTTALFSTAEITSTFSNGTEFTCDNFERNQTIEFWKSSFPSQDYWQKIILSQTDGIDETGTLVWQLVLALFITYFVVYLMLIKGVAVFGKLVYFIATFPYLVLLILGIRAWMLPGADEGIKFYVIPDWSRLSDINVWKDAATQIFFTLAISYGGMLTFASYNKFSTNVMRDAFIIPFANCITSFFAGFVIFGYIGYLSKITGQDIGDVIQAGQGLAFVVYPYAVTTIAGAPVWSCLFFFMMALLGLDSTLGSIEVTIASVLDFIPALAKRRTLTITGIFTFYYICGLLFCFQSGTYWLEFFNSYAGDWSILVTAAFECLVISYAYGFKNIKNDIRAMLGNWAVDGKKWYVFCALWGCISPTLMIFIIIMTLTQLKPLTLGEYTFPDWTLPVGQLMTASITFGVLGWIIYCLIDCFKNGKPLSSLVEPDFETYQPKKENDRIAVEIIRGLRTETEVYQLKNLDSTEKEITPIENEPTPFERESSPTEKESNSTFM